MLGGRDRSQRAGIGPDENINLNQIQVYKKTKKDEEAKKKVVSTVESSHTKEIRAMKSQIRKTDTLLGILNVVVILLYAVEVKTEKSKKLKPEIDLYKLFL